MVTPTLKLQNKAPGWETASRGSLQPSEDPGWGQGEDGLRPRGHREIQALLVRREKVVWGKRWQEWDSWGQILFHRFERKRENRPRI